jgi:ribosomal protein L11 methyltransferase
MIALFRLDRIDLKRYFAAVIMAQKHREVNLEMKMPESEERRKSRSPYRDLHVYLIKGVVKPGDEADLGDAFLGTWVEGESSFLFFSVPANVKIDALLERRPSLSLEEEHRFTYEEWQGAYPEPIRIEHFFIVPPWIELEAGEGEMRIVLDPGVVFGTGIHPTTGDCLRAMEYLHGKAPFESVLDLGTGTGILALAAARLGAKRVWAVDLNPLCVKTSMKNAGLNHVEDIVEVLEGKVADFVGKPADLVVANIHFEVLKELVEKKDFREKPWFILSGLMRSQGKDIKTRLESFGQTVVKEWDGAGTWATMLLRGC